MREIKFRVWDEFTKKMYYQIELVKKEDGYWWVWSNGLLKLNSESQRRKLMQFTSLTDKNGKDDYDKDICKYKDDSNIEQIGIIEWDNGWFLDAINGDDEGNQDCFLDEVEHENIGNIFDNPELLTNDKP